MDEYAREMMDLKTLVTRVLEKKGVLARIRAELRANVFAAIEEEDRGLENEENPTFALLGSSNARAKELHSSPTGKLLTALICDYLEWGHLEYTLKVYLPECNLPRGFWKSELKEKLGQTTESGVAKDRPLLVDIIESYLKQEQQNSASNLTGSFAKLAVRRAAQASPAASDDLQADIDKHNSNRRSSSTALTGRRGGLTSIGQMRNGVPFPRNYSSDHNVAEDSASIAERTLHMDTNTIDTLGEVNYISQSLVDGPYDGGMAKDMDMQSSEKMLEENGTVNRSQLVNSWRQRTSIVSYDTASLESLEEVVEEEDAAFEKGSCSSTKESYSSA